MLIKIKHIFLSFIAAAFVVAAILPGAASASLPVPDGGTTTSPASPTPGGGSCPERVFTFPAWYRGVIDTGTCQIKIVNITDFIKIPINALEMLIQAVAYVALGYIIWGGFKYVKSQGDPGKITEAKGAIINAVSGLAIALGSVAIVEFIQGGIK